MRYSAGFSRARRGWLAGTAAAIFAAIGLLPWPATGAEGVADDSPEAMILNLSREVLDAIRADKSIQAGDFNGVQRLVNERIMPRVDFDRMTRMAVGQPWRGASPDQRSALTEQFRLLLMRTYAGALSHVSDQTVRLRPGRGQEPSNEIIVRTQIISSQSDPVSLDYRLEKTDAGWKIYDLNILGVWLVQNYRSEFQAPLSQGGVDNLIQVLTEKNRKSASTAKTS